jgi:hypothetical protein
MFVTNPLTNYPIRVGGRTFATLVRQIQTNQVKPTEQPRTAGSSQRVKQVKRVKRAGTGSTLLLLGTAAKSKRKPTTKKSKAKSKSKSKLKQKPRRVIQRRSRDQGDHDLSG